jgi:hypothetical protein
MQLGRALYSCLALDYLLVLDLADGQDFMQVDAYPLPARALVFTSIGKNAMGPAP